MYRTKYMNCSCVHLDSHEAQNTVQMSAKLTTPLQSTFSDRSDDDTEDDDIISFLHSTGALSGLPFNDKTTADEDAATSLGGYKPGRRPNKPRAFNGCLQRLEMMYFNDDCVYYSADFERRFRMPRVMFDRFA